MAEVKNIEQRGSNYHFDLEQPSNGQMVHVVYKTARVKTDQNRSAPSEEAN